MPPFSSRHDGAAEMMLFAALRRSRFMSCRIRTFAERAVDGR